MYSRRRQEVIRKGSQPREEQFFAGLFYLPNWGIDNILTKLHNPPMVCKTPAGEIRQILDEQYGLKMGKVLRATEGLSNQHLIVNSSIGQLTIRTPKNGDLTLEKLALEARVTHFLQAAGLPVRSIVKTYDGRDYVITSTGKPLTVFRFIAGHYLKEVKLAHLVEVGATLKKLHQALANFEGQGQLVHGDFNPSNFVFTNDQVSGIYDFEHVHYGQTTEDLATLIAHYVFLLPDWPPQDIIDQILSGYCGYSSNSVVTDSDTCRQLSIRFRRELREEVVRKAEWLASWQAGTPEFYEKRLTELRSSVKLYLV